MLKFDAEYFDPKATIESGQLFRYHKIAENDYLVYSLDKKCRVAREGNQVILDTQNEEYFYNFFDLATDYASINNYLLGFSELRDAAAYGKGIRILKQNLYECIISFIISANNNIPRIKGIIQKICSNYGEGKQGFNAFPTMQSLLAVTKEEFRRLGAGFRDTYLFETTKKLAGLQDKNTALYTSDFLDALTKMNNDEAYKALCALKGIGPKVADCIMLFGLARMNRFPVDVWMFRACASKELDCPKKVGEFYTARYGEYAGIAQQYIFYFARENKFVKI